MTYEETMQKQYEYLDQVDFWPFIETYTDLQKLKDAMEDAYRNSPITQNNFLEGDLFMEMDLYDLACYIIEKYNVKYIETLIPHYYRGPFINKTNQE